MLRSGALCYAPVRWGVGGGFFKKASTALLNENEQIILKTR